MQLLKFRVLIAMAVVLRWSWFVGQSEGENKVYSEWF